MDNGFGCSTQRCAWHVYSNIHFLTARFDCAVTLRVPWLQIFVDMWLFLKNPAHTETKKAILKLWKQFWPQGSLCVFLLYLCCMAIICIKERTEIWKSKDKTSKKNLDMNKKGSNRSLQSAVIRTPKHTHTRTHTHTHTHTNQTGTHYISLSQSAFNQLI